MNAELSGILNRVDAYYASGRTPEALPYLTNAAGHYLKRYGKDIEYASLLSEIGGIRRGSGRLAESRAAFVEAAETARFVPGPHFPPFSYKFIRTL